MHPRARFTLCLIIAILCAAPPPPWAAVPQLLNYQGRVVMGGTNFHGTGQFKFALVDGGTLVTAVVQQATAEAVVLGGEIAAVTVREGGAGYLNAPSVEIQDKEGGFGARAVAIVAGGMVKEINVIEPGAGYSGDTQVLIVPPDAAPHTDYISFWSHDGSSAAGSEPTTALSLPVMKGLYSVLLGETPTMNAIPLSVFTNADVRLRVWFNDGAHGFQQFTPDQRLAAVGYAMMAAAVPESAITAGMIAGGAIGSTHLAPGTVQSAHIAGGAVGAFHVTPGSIGSTHLATSAVHAVNIAPAAVGAAALADDSVTSAALADGAVNNEAIAAGAVTQWKLGGMPAPTGQVTIANPDPVVGDQLGSSLAQVGADRLWVGAPHKTAGAITNAGAVCIFSATGGLLQTITNVAASSGDAFGYSVAAAGGDRVVIGVPYADAGPVANAGSVCLFSTTGVFVATVPNPATQADDGFGLSLAGLPNGFAVGACYDNPGGVDNAGSVYLYTSVGALSATIANPAPAAYDFFGHTLAGVGGNLVLIGAHCDDPSGVTDTGSIYLYSTNGTLILTIANPEPENADWFGQGLADLGSGVIAVGAPGDNAAGTDSGSVFLMNTNGVLLNRIVNPEPAASDFFGLSIASAGPEWFVVGACYDDGSGADSGRGYLYDRSGRLLSVITNPAAASGDRFACGVARFGGGVAIGANGSDAGASDAGRVYLFSIDRIGDPGVCAWNLVDGSVGSAQLTSNLTVRGTLTASGDVMAPRLQVGYGHSLTGAGSTIAGGQNNAIANSFATIGGGYQNSASGYAVVIGGGHANAASGPYATVGGGYQNTANEFYAVVCGGWSNSATAYYAAVGGGRENSASGTAATVAAGWRNTSSGDSATVGGGYENVASGYIATVAGGDGNIASNFWTTVGGGKDNLADGRHATVGGGFGNSARKECSVVGGGAVNVADGESATVGGGTNNHAHSIYATVSGGALSDAIALGATVGGGVDNWSAGDYSTIAGGCGNTAQGNSATVPGGNGNYANGNYSFATGQGCQALGNYSFAAGKFAYASHNNSFVWSDGWIGGTSSSTNNEFVVVAHNGMDFWNGSARRVNLCGGYSGTTINTSTGGYLSDGGNWVDNCDRTSKANFAPVDGRAVLEGVVALPISTWNYVAEDPAVRHLGPVAQDFYGAFGLGRDDKHIGALDSAGVALAAIQGLYNEVKDRDAQIDELKERLKALENRLKDIENIPRPSSRNNL